MKKYGVADVCDSARAEELVKKYGSPLFIYKENIIKDKVNKLMAASEGFDIKYALKANTNTTIVKLIKSMGISQVDVVSPGQIHKALNCGFKPEDIMYTENFISQQEMKQALQIGVTLNIGALDTLKHYQHQLKGKNIFVRINPKVGAGPTFHVITGGPKTKFGVYQDDLEEFIKISDQNSIKIKGIHQHIGSNLKKHDQEVFLQTLEYVASLLPRFKDVQTINVGGGLGVAYKDHQQLSDPVDLYSKVRAIIKKSEEKLNKSIKISIEPGRFIVADSGTLLCTLTACKSTPQMNFFGTDTGFTHLMRPALYGSYHAIINLTNPNGPTKKVTVCGNICESTDVLGKDIELGGQIGDILAIENVGAYGFSMSSNYNQRPKPAEVLINGNNEAILIRRRQTYKDLEEKI